MTSQVIVPHRPGPLAELPDGEGTGPEEPQTALFGVTEIVLAAGGGVLLAAVPLAGLPAWLSVVAVACLALGAGLPANAALLIALRRRGERRRRAILARGTVLDVSDPSVRRLVAAYGRLERTADAGMARDAGHQALTEVAGLLAGRPPQGRQVEYVLSRADAVSALADRIADGPVMPVELVHADALTRIRALLG